MIFGDELIAPLVVEEALKTISILEIQLFSKCTVTVEQFACNSLTEDFRTGMKLIVPKTLVLVFHYFLRARSFK